MPIGSLNMPNLDMMYITFTYTPLARIQSHDETVSLSVYSGGKGKKFGVELASLYYKSSSYVFQL